MKARRREYLSAFVMTTFVLVTGAHAVAAHGLGPELRANTFTKGHEYFPGVAAGGTGNFVVAWESSFQEGYFDACGAFGRLCDAAGNRVADEFLIDRRPARLRATARPSR